ncbi:MAG TPA: hypothetical protein VGM90_03445 [Kofleriaceae bacterium]
MAPLENTALADETKPPPFTLGSSRAAVEAAQGVPSAKDTSFGETWSYGTASVDFRNGKVLGWHASPFTSLNVILVPKDSAKAEAARTRGTFTLGSARDEVMAVQGTPTTLDLSFGEAWSYGTSTIEFANGKVRGWHTSPVGPALKVAVSFRDSPTTREAQTNGSFAANATKDEVLAVEGTPTGIDVSFGETWSYGTSTLTFRNGRVSEYHSSPVGPVLRISSATAPVRRTASVNEPQPRAGNSDGSPTTQVKSVGATATGSFAVGASAERVRSVQGQPDRVLNNSAIRETWLYGTASVVLEQGKVVEYRNSGGTLHVD